MKDYTLYSSIDFAEDQDFVRWVKVPDQDSNNTGFWVKFENEHPKKSEEIREARSLILAVLSEMETEGIEKKQEMVWNKLKHSIHQDKKAIAPSRQFLSYKIAAVLLLLISAAAIVFWTSNDSSAPTLQKEEHVSFVKEINNGMQPKTIVLGDGSTIILQPKSTIQYPEIFSENLREIQLDGEAFFDVAKDPSSQFIVYSDQLVTTVTGTSFTIRAFENQDNLVQVKTGKVSVFAKADVQSNKMKADQQREGVLLTPNQQVVFSQKESQLIKSLVENPQLLNSKIQNFEFKDTPLTEVFQQLEKAYGIEIVYDAEVLGTCSLNASLNNIPLYDQMRLICKGVNAKYEILDSRIIVSGKGCNN